MLNIYYVLVLPIIFLPVLFVLNIIDRRYFEYLFLGFAVSCITFAFTEKLYISTLSILVSIIVYFVLKFTVKSCLVLSPLKGVSQVIVVGCSQDGSCIVSDGTTEFSVNYKAKQGTVLNVGFECFE